MNKMDKINEFLEFKTELDEKAEKIHSFMYKTNNVGFVFYEFDYVEYEFDYVLINSREWDRCDNIYRKDYYEMKWEIFNKSIEEIESWLIEESIKNKDIRNEN